jgi:hypothetical protein
MILRRNDPFAQVVVPDHKELDRGTLRAIIRHVNLTTEEFTSLLLPSAAAPDKRQAPTEGSRQALALRIGDVRTKFGKM